MSYFGIFKLSMLAPYKGYGKQEKKKKAYVLSQVFHHNLTITPFSPALTHLPTTLT